MSRTVIVALYKDILARPEAPLAIVGPFADRAAADAYVATWQPQLADGYRLERSRLPEPGELAGHMATTGVLADPPKQCPHMEATACCVRGRGHRGEHAFHPSMSASRSPKGEAATDAR